MGHIKHGHRVLYVEVTFWHVLSSRSYLLPSSRRSPHFSPGNSPVLTFVACSAVTWAPRLRGAECVQQSTGGGGGGGFWHDEDGGGPCAAGLPAADGCLQPAVQILSC